MRLVLHGYRYSVYLRTVRLVLAEKGLEAGHREVNPFATLPPGYGRLHPFGRVPVLEHGPTLIYETAAIARYLDEAFPGPALQPETPRSRARMVQAISVVDNYAYWPLVRQVFSHAVFRPASGEPADAGAIAAGMSAAPRVLAALSAMIEEREGIGGARPTLADLHLAPMIAAFAQAPGAAAMIAGYPALAAWWAGMAPRASMAATDPGLPA